MKVHAVEQNGDVWMALRAGKPTASEFSKLITSTGEPSKSMKAYAEELGGELYAGRPLDTWNGNKYTEYGHDTEDEGVASYELLKGVETEKVGFITDDLEQYGCSPDRLVGDDGLLEMKCLPKKHIAALRYWAKHKKCPPDYVQQTQGQMFITGRQWCDLCFYRPELPTLVIRVTPDEKIITGLRAQLAACIAERNLVYRFLQEFSA